MTSPSLFLVRAVHRPPTSPSASSTPTPRRGARQHVLPDEPLQPHKAGPLTPPHRHAPTTPGPLCPPRASLTAVAPSSSRPRTAPPEAGVMPPSSTTSHCPPATAPANQVVRLARGHAVRLQKSEQPSTGCSPHSLVLRPGAQNRRSSGPVDLWGRSLRSFLSEFRGGSRVVGGVPHFRQRYMLHQI
jgi:hypothetical protein